MDTDGYLLEHLGGSRKQAKGNHTTSSVLFLSPAQQLHLGCKKKQKTSMACPALFFQSQLTSTLRTLAPLRTCTVTSLGILRLARMDGF